LAKKLTMSRSFKAPFHMRFTFHLRVWHRRLGISASAFILFLSLSGLLLNHTDDLALPHAHVNQSWLLSLYGIQQPEKFRSFKLAGIEQNHLTSVDDQLWFIQNQPSSQDWKFKWIQSDLGELKSAVVFNQVIVVAIGHEILLLDLQGGLIDRMSETMGIPPNIAQLYADTDKLWAKTEQGIFTTDEQLLQWQRLVSVTEPEWLQSVRLSDEQRAIASLHYRSRLLTWERVLLDVHSGRIWGKFGPLFSDLIALLLIMLSFSGIYMWMRGPKKISRGLSKQKNKKS